MNSFLDLYLYSISIAGGIVVVVAKDYLSAVNNFWLMIDGTDEGHIYCGDRTNLIVKLHSGGRIIFADAPRILDWQLKDNSINGYIIQDDARNIPGLEECLQRKMRTYVETRRQKERGQDSEFSIINMPSSWYPDWDFEDVPSGV